MDTQSPMTAAPFVPTDDDNRSLLDWFDRYDAHVRRNDVEAMADMAAFPLVVMSSDSAGEPVTREWDRATFVRMMSMAVDGMDPASVSMDNRRRPAFLGPDIAVVTTDSAVTVGDDTQHMRYVDVLTRSAGEWRFTSMIQAGWGDMLKEYA